MHHLDRQKVIEEYIKERLFFNSRTVLYGFFPITAEVTSNPL